MINPGADSIEHGHGADHEAIEMMKAKGVFLVPTVGRRSRCQGQGGAVDAGTGEET